MVKKILSVVLVVVLVGAIVVAYEWFKPHPKPKNGIPITSVALTKEYTGDEKTSDTKYLNKTLEVSGTIDAVSNNQDGSMIITLESGDPMAEVQCTMEDKNLKLAKGQNVTVVGFCKGNNMGVVLTSCSIK